MQLRAQYGCGAQSQIVGKKSNEHKSAHRKIARSRGYENLDAYTVPVEFHEICFTDYENLGQPKGIKFYQGNSENCEYFFLESELNFLQNLNIFLDGTFMLVKNVIHSQVYIISINITNLALNTTFSYPIFDEVMCTRFWSMASKIFQSKKIEWIESSDKNFNFELKMINAFCQKVFGIKNAQKKSDLEVLELDRFKDLKSRNIDNFEKISTWSDFEFSGNMIKISRH